MVFGRGASSRQTPAIDPHYVVEEKVQDMATNGRAQASVNSASQSDYVDAQAFTSAQQI
jgi:hypothetical protein